MSRANTSLIIGHDKPGQSEPRVTTNPTGNASVALHVQVQSCPPVSLPQPGLLCRKSLSNESYRAGMRECEFGKHGVSHSTESNSSTDNGIYIYLTVTYSI